MLIGLFCKNTIFIYIPIRIHFKKNFVPFLFFKVRFKVRSRRHLIAMHCLVKHAVQDINLNRLYILAAYFAIKITDALFLINCHPQLFFLIYK